MSKKLRISISLLAIFVLVLMAGCGGGGDSGGAKYETQTFTLGEFWELTITNDEVVYDEEGECDNLVVYLTAKNISDEKRAFANTANINTYQGEDRNSLGLGDAKDKDGNELHNTSAKDEEIEPGDSIELVYTWELEDDSDVLVNFAGYTITVEGAEITFVVKDRISEEWKDSMEAKKKELADKKSMKSFDVLGFKGEVAEGWYVDEIDEDKIKLVKEKDDASKGPEGYIDIDTKSSSIFGNAQENAKSSAENFKMDGTTKITIGGTEYICLSILDDQFMLFKDCADGVNTVKFRSMFMSLDEAKEQIEKIQIK